MATRDPNLVSETTIILGSHIAVVRETTEEKESKFELVSPKDLPQQLHSQFIQQAKDFEKEVKK